MSGGSWKWRPHLAATFLTALLGWQTASAGTEARPRPRQLMIVLDSIPFFVADELTDPALGDQAYFQEFQRPVPFISTFPSSTSVAMGGILGPMGLERSPGYEARFFDWEKRRAIGGGLFSYFKVEFPWRTYFDWGRKGPVGSAFEAVRPIKSGTKRLRKAVDDFLSSDKDTFLIYVAATDTAAHVMNPDALRRFMIELDSILRVARSKSLERPFEVVMFSDHGIAGGEPLINTFKPLKKAIKQAGFRAAKKINGPKDVVFTPFGLVSSFEVYLNEEVEQSVAGVLVQSEGVDLCAYRDADLIWIVDRDGKAAVDHRITEAGMEWRYTPQDSDPLQYGPLIERLQASKTPSSEGWVTDSDLFEASTEVDYPDAFYRIRSAFEMVLNPASIVCSLEPGFMFGAPRTAALAKFGKGKLRWTHGALMRAPSIGFLMSDSASWERPGAARFDRGLLPFVEAFGERESKQE